MNPQTEMQPRAVPPDGMFERLVGVATPDREPDFTITSYGKNDALHVVLGFRQVNEMDRGREIEGVVAVEAVNARNSRTGKFALTVGLMLQKAASKFWESRRNLSLFRILIAQLFISSRMKNFQTPQAYLPSAEDSSIT